MELRDHAHYIIKKTIEAVLPNEAVKRALKSMDLQGKNIYLVSIGKAGFSMAKAASDVLGEKIKQGIVITKYDHVKYPLINIDCYEAGHPISDDNTYAATKKVLELVDGLDENDLVVFLVSGGGSALFEDPIIDKEELEDINKQLLESGANITEINTIRKRLSNVKGGKFAQKCAPAQVKTIILSDIIGDPLDMIASGPAYADSSTSEDAFRIIEKYSLKLNDKIIELMKFETPKHIENVDNIITGSVSQLCKYAALTAEEIGYKPIILTDNLDCQAKEAGYMLGSIAYTNRDRGPQAIIMGGETIVNITGSGKGGRNQEIALAASQKIKGLDNIVIFSVGSDGTDGPTDAAGGIVDGLTALQLEQMGVDIHKILKDNDSYNALDKVGGLVITGPTGTNVNDFQVILIK